MYKKCFLTLPATVIKAMEVIESSAAGIALAVDEGERLLGTLSDGDLRRGLLRGMSLHDSIETLVRAQCFCVSPETPRSLVLDIMQSRHINQVPIVDGNRRVVGMHLLHSLLGAERKGIPAVIMTGGKGTRLGSLTANTPKPMLKVAGRPILERIILHLMSYGITDIYLAVNHLAEIIEDYFGNGEKLGCSIKYLRESKPLGSGGAVSLLPETVKTPVILMNGDLITEANIGNLIDFHQSNGFYATMGCSSYIHEIPFGCIEANGAKLIEISEKPTITRWINAGIYMLSEEAVRAIPRDEFFPITRLFDDALQTQKPCGVYTIDGDWIDIGQKAQLDYARGLV